MRASSDNLKELKKEFSILYKDLKARIDLIEKHQNDASQFAVEKFRKLEKDIPNNINQIKSIKKLKTLYRDLKQISNLKTSTLFGAQQAKELFEPVMDKLSLFGEDDQADFWRAYQNLYEESHMFEYFKYEILDILSEAMVADIDSEIIVKDMIKRFRSRITTLSKQGRYNENELRLAYGRSLRNLRKKYF